MFSRDPEIQLLSEIRVELRGILKAATMRRSMWNSQYKWQLLKIKKNPFMISNLNNRIKC